MHTPTTPPHSYPYDSQESDTPLSDVCVEDEDEDEMPDNSPSSSSSSFSFNPPPKSVNSSAPAIFRPRADTNVATARSKSNSNPSPVHYATPPNPHPHPETNVNTDTTDVSTGLTSPNDIAGTPDTLSSPVRRDFSTFVRSLTDEATSVLRAINASLAANNASLEAELAHLSQRDVELSVDVKRLEDAHEELLSINEGLVAQAHDLRGAYDSVLEDKERLAGEKERQLKEMREEMREEARREMRKEMDREMKKERQNTREEYILILALAKTFSERSIDLNRKNETLREQLDQALQGARDIVQNNNNATERAEDTSASHSQSQPDQQTDTGVQTVITVRTDRHNITSGPPAVYPSQQYPPYPPSAQTKPTPSVYHNHPFTFGHPRAWSNESGLEETPHTGQQYPQHAQPTYPSAHALAPLHSRSHPPLRGQSTPSTYHPHHYAHSYLNTYPSHAHAPLPPPRGDARAPNPNPMAIANLVADQSRTETPRHSDPTPGLSSISTTNATGTNARSSSVQARTFVSTSAATSNARSTTSTSTFNAHTPGSTPRAPGAPHQENAIYSTYSTGFTSRGTASESRAVSTTGSTLGVAAESNVDGTLNQSGGNDDMMPFEIMISSSGSASMGIFGSRGQRGLKGVWGRRPSWFPSPS